MVNITNTKSCPYISSPPYISPPAPMYKPTKKCLRTNISPGLIFGGLEYGTFHTYFGYIVVESVGHSTTLTKSITCPTNATLVTYFSQI